MVTRYGMSKGLGNLTYGVPHASRFLKMPFASEEKNYSERTSEQIDVEVREIIDRLYSKVKTTLAERRNDLDSRAAVLIKKETLDRGELEQLLALPRDATQPTPPVLQ